MGLRFPYIIACIWSVSSSIIRINAWIACFRLIYHCSADGWLTSGRIDNSYIPSIILTDEQFTNNTHVWQLLANGVHNEITVEIWVCARMTFMCARHYRQDLESDSKGLDRDDESNCGRIRSLEFRNIIKLKQLYNKFNKKTDTKKRGNTQPNTYGPHQSQANKRNYFTSSYRRSCCWRSLFPARSPWLLLS